MSVRDVNAAADRFFVNHTVDEQSFDEVVKAAGKVAPDELAAIVDRVNDQSLKITGAVRDHIDSVVDTLQSLLAEKEESNRVATREGPALIAEMQQRMQAGAATKSFGGSEIPEAVKTVINTALQNGAAGYDVRELDNPGFDEEHGEWSANGHWTPYPQEANATGVMAFSHTEVTPAKVEKDMTTVQTYWQIDGYESVQTMQPGAEPEQIPKYKKVTGTGTGNISAHYDEVGHSKMTARGSDGQIWANNFAILSDGSLHCVPAMRRYADQPDLILTNPSLARGKLMLSNGHIEMRSGVIVSVGISGRLQNRVNDGDIKLVDPLAILRAWGFQIAPDCRVAYEGGGTAPKIDPATNVISPA